MTLPIQSARRSARLAERGAATAEYCAVTLGATSVAAILIKIVQSDFFQHLLQGLLTKIPDILPFF